MSNDVGTARLARQLASDGPLPAAEPDVALKVVRASTLASRSVPDRPFIVPGLIPDRNVTALVGDGGLGKSMIAKQLAVAMTSDTPFMGLEVATGPVMIFSAEDELDEIHRRIAAICRKSGVDLSQLHDLHILPLVGQEALLAVPSRDRSTMTRTSLYHSVVDLLSALRPKLLIIDTQADTYGGNEIDRGQVRSFVTLLRGLTVQFDMAVLLLSHPSVQGMNSGSGTSGSTAWSNSVRSRLYLERRKRDRDDPEQADDLRKLTVAKANYAATGQEIALRWDDGIFAVEDGQLEAERQVIADAKASVAETIFVELLTLYNDQKLSVSPSPSAKYAPTVFARRKDARGMRMQAFKAAMERLLRAGAIHIRQMGPPSKLRPQLFVGPSPERPSDPLPTLI